LSIGHTHEKTSTYFGHIAIIHDHSEFNSIFQVISQNISPIFFLILDFTCTQVGHALLVDEAIAKEGKKNLNPRTYLGDTLSSLQGEYLIIDPYAYKVVNTKKI